MCVNFFSNNLFKTDFMKKWNFIYNKAVETIFVDKKKYKKLILSQ